MKVLDKVEDLDSRMSPLEKKVNTSISSYAIVSFNPVRLESERLEKLEYLSSEEERKRRILQVTVSHPNIGSSIFCRRTVRLKKNRT